MEKFGKALIIEDDRDVQRAARVALGTHFSSITLAENAAHLDQWLDASTDVVLLDMNFALGVSSGRDGLHALARIRVIDPALSVVLMTAYGSVSLAVETLKQGAVDWLEKPCDEATLLAAVQRAAHLSHEMAAEAQRRAWLLERWNALSPRQQEVARLVATGISSKEVARALAQRDPDRPIDPRTVDTHRSAIFLKLDIRSSHELGKLVEELGLADDPPSRFS